MTLAELPAGGAERGNASVPPAVPPDAARDRAASPDVKDR
ncbi:hypothetical protein JD81_04056 [Micromonospora sagamiensis]|uniref:Uncharacterized protein n=1 Tax=Micromonospora sagamiensis TaxID=47875 RepID=A0A562WKE6_9ACTN|nr:hypothetical protein JD81_04056 [Micromonospora sagamiensis]